MDLRQTPRYKKYLQNIGWIVEEKDGVFYFIKKLPLVGSVLKIQRPKKNDLKFIDKLAKKYKSFMIILEPETSIVSSQKNSHITILQRGFKITKSSYLPTKTTVIDLKLTEAEMLKRMHYKARYNIKKTQNSKLRTQNSNDIKLFADFWQECALKQRGMYIGQKKEIHALFEAFKNKCDVVFVFTQSSSHNSQANKPLAAIFNVYTSDSAFYMYAAASVEGKKMYAPTLAAWESIKLAKKKGLKYYDFEGIFDERFPIPSWKGFSRFKISFGGGIIEYPGSYIKYRLPI